MTTGPGDAPVPRYPRYPGDEQPRDDLGRSGGPAPASVVPGHPAPVGGLPGPAVAGRQSERPAGWWVRVLASVVDSLVTFAIALVPLVAGAFVAFSGATYDDTTETYSDVETSGVVLMGAAFLVLLLFDVWNRGLRVGYRGQSLGKQLVRVHVVGGDGAPVGALVGFFRWLVTWLLGWTFVGALLDVLWPLWDDRKQTIHDKAVSTYPVRR